MKLKEISKKDVLTQRVVGIMMKFAPILLFAEFYGMVGNADNPRKSATASGGKFRALNDNFSDNKVDPAFADVALKIFGDRVQVDVAHERRGSDTASVRLSELDNFSKNLGKEFQNQLVNGDSTTATNFDGIKKLVPSGQKITPATDGIEVPLGNDSTSKKKQQVFLEQLFTLLEKIDGGAQLLLMDSKTLSRLNSIAREFIRYEMTKFGVRIGYFNEVPILLSGYSKSGSLVIPHDETVGASTDCTSIYGMSFGERSDLTIATSTGVSVTDLGKVGAHYEHDVEMDACPALLNDKSLARLEGIRIVA
jgi:hypothetical protein